REQTYWGRPVPGFGPANARIGVVGLAPAAHGANRTGRIFTGDRSGDWLFASLHGVGLASQSYAVSADDGLQLPDMRIMSAGRCAPPAGKPTPAERDQCAPAMLRELSLLSRLSVIVVLGGFAWTALLGALAGARTPVPRPRPVFGHGAEVTLPDGLQL